jgi:MFS family permease
MLGLLFCGVAIGPTIGGLLISSTNNILSVFYVAAGLHATYMLLMLFVVPESLTKEMAYANSEQAKQRAERAREAREVREMREAENGKPITLSRRLGRSLRVIFFFMKPLTIVLPHRIEGTRRRDWNLTMLAISYGMITLLTVSPHFYSFLTFHTIFCCRHPFNSSSSTPVICMDGRLNNLVTG